MKEIRYLLAVALKQNATELFIMAGRPLTIRVDGHLQAIEKEMLTPNDTLGYIKNLYKFSERQFPDKGVLDDNFTCSVAGLARFRICAFRQRSSYAATVKVVQFGIPNSKKLGIPDEVMQVAEAKSGLVVVTGSAGSGKSTTVSCLINSINKTQDKHIVTIEDPIEYIHHNEASIVTQREIGTDSMSFKEALRSAMRQSANVIYVSEMTNAETAQVLYDAACTGRLVITTMHIQGAQAALKNFLSYLPDGRDLTNTVKAIVSQQLVYSINGKLIPVFEVLGSDGTWLLDKDTYAKRLFSEGLIDHGVFSELHGNPG